MADDISPITDLIANNIIRTGNNVMNSFQYRAFLTRNAE